MGEQLNPTYESVKAAFGLNSKQHVNQIIRDKLTSKVKKGSFETLIKISEVIDESEMHCKDDLVATLSIMQLIEPTYSVKGILNLLKAYGLNKSYKIYNTDIEQATKKEIEGDEFLLILDEKKARALHSIMKKVKTMPGKHGLCNLYDVFRHFEIDVEYFKLVKSTLIHSASSWAIEIDEFQMWYMLENRDNTLINCIGKLTNVTQSIKIEILSQIIYEYLSKRTLPLRLPTTEIIEAYLRNSKYLEAESDSIRISIESVDLSPIESRIITIFTDQKRTILKYSDLVKLLSEFETSKVNMDKALYNSPILYVDKSKGRGYYEFVIASHFSNIAFESGLTNEYYEYKKKLAKLYGETDHTANTKLRREQHILSDWLFKGKESEKCAVCGNEYSVNALVTAHKKKRANCTEGERTDPYIVMPLCLFGCDYLYENELISIENGVVKPASNKKKYGNESAHIEKIQNRRIDKRWVAGNETYFKR